MCTRLPTYQLSNYRVKKNSKNTCEDSSSIDEYLIDTIEQLPNKLSDIHEEFIESKTNNKKLCEELDNSQRNYREFQKKVSNIELELQEKENIIVRMCYQMELSEIEKEN